MKLEALMLSSARTRSWCRKLEQRVLEELTMAVRDLPLLRPRSGGKVSHERFLDVFAVVVSIIFHRQVHDRLQGG